MGLLRRRATAFAAGVTLVVSASGTRAVGAHAAEAPFRSIGTNEGGEESSLDTEPSMRRPSWFEQAIQMGTVTAAFVMSFSSDEAEEEALPWEARRPHGAIRGGSGAGSGQSGGYFELSLGAWLPLSRKPFGAGGDLPPGWSLESESSGGEYESELPSDDWVDFEDGPVEFEDDQVQGYDWTYSVSSEDEYVGELTEAVEGPVDSEDLPLGLDTLFDIFSSYYGGLASDGEADHLTSSTGLPTRETDGLVRYGDGGATAQSRRRVMTSSDESSYFGQYLVEVRAEVLEPATSWSGAEYTLMVGDPIYGQQGKASQTIGRGGITQGDDLLETSGHHLERGCYVLWTTDGTRPYEVQWTVLVDGEEVEGATGGGVDRHTFGVGGALCDLSTCYSDCFEEWEMNNDADTNMCANYGDMLAPLDEPYGGNCSCSSEEQLELRLECLNFGDCTPTAQCYIAEGTVVQAPVVRIVVYMAFEATTFNVSCSEEVIAAWLDLDASYVYLEFEDGESPSGEAVNVRRRSLTEAGAMEQTMDLGERRLESGTFKRLEFRIIAYDEDDVLDITSTVDAGVWALNTVLSVQEDDAFNTANAYAASNSTSVEYVADEDIPTTSIAQSGGSNAVSSAQVENEATTAPVEETHFTESAQFIVGAGLVVVVAAALSFVACIVCHMKWKTRREFISKNTPVNGEPKPVEIFDPWASVARNFTRVAPNGKGT